MYNTIPPFLPHQFYFCQITQQLVIPPHFPGHYSFITTKNSVTFVDYLDILSNYPTSWLYCLNVSVYSTILISFHFVAYITLVYEPNLQCSPNIQYLCSTCLTLWVMRPTLLHVLLQLNGHLLLTLGDKQG